MGLAENRLSLNGSEVSGDGSTYVKLKYNRTEATFANRLFSSVTAFITLRSIDIYMPNRTPYPCHGISSYQHQSVIHMKVKPSFVNGISNRNVAMRETLQRKVTCSESLVPVTAIPPRSSPVLSRVRAVVALVLNDDNFIIAPPPTWSSLLYDDSLVDDAGRGRRPQRWSARTVYRYALLNDSLFNNLGRSGSPWGV